MLQTNGSYSIISLDGNHSTCRAVTTGHEILGHGYLHSQGYSTADYQYIEAIRTENMVLRVMGLPYVNDGRTHSMTDFPLLFPSLLPIHR